MKKALTVFMTSVFLGIAAPLALAQDAKDWVDIKDPDELRAIYSNKTFRGNGWIGHYRSDGKGVLIRQGGKPEPRTWDVKGNDQVCVTPEGGTTRCATFKWVSKTRNELMVTFDSSGMSLLFTVEDGIPKF